ncbi:hypothetical protein L484_003798 [Morus notabilis]|uniref:Uncharacterized protein n=1 Tax=Morus notabilis TaxID=981085 RepID=W9RD43_9ROSA|nr:hypothetical protein L484_003798 [Morus notabilis]
MDLPGTNPFKQALFKPLLNTTNVPGAGASEIYSRRAKILTFFNGPAILLFPLWPLPSYFRLCCSAPLSSSSSSSLCASAATKADSSPTLRFPSLPSNFHISLISAAACPQISTAQRQFDECSSSLKWNKDRVVGLEMKLTSLQEELRSTKEVAAANEEQLSGELSIVCSTRDLSILGEKMANKLVDLYKESSEEWSKKARDLEGVIKALETHLSQVQNDYNERLEKEVSARHQFKKNFTKWIEIYNFGSISVQQVRVVSQVRGSIRVACHFQFVSCQPATCTCRVRVAVLNYFRVTGRVRVTRKKTDTV